MVRVFCYLVQISVLGILMNRLPESLTFTLLSHVHFLCIHSLLYMFCEDLFLQNHQFFAFSSLLIFKRPYIMEVMFYYHPKNYW